MIFRGRIIQSIWSPVEPEDLGGFCELLQLWWTHYGTCIHIWSFRAIFRKRIERPEKEMARKHFSSNWSKGNFFLKNSDTRIVFSTSAGNLKLNFGQYLKRKISHFHEFSSISQRFMKLSTIDFIIKVPVPVETRKIISMLRNIRPKIALRLRNLWFCINMTPNNLLFFRTLTN